MNGVPTSHLKQRAGIIAVASLILYLLGMVLAAQRFFPSYLVAWLFCLGISLGGMAILLVHQLTGGVWGFPLRPPLQAAMETLPLLALLCVPLLFRLDSLYPWARPDTVAASALLQQKIWYLDLAFFRWRTVIYFALWLAIAYYLSRGLVHASRDAAANGRGLRGVASAGLIVYGLTITFAATDWVMSLTPVWRSSEFGLLVGEGEMLSAFSFALLCLAWAPREPLAPALDAELYHDLGNLLLMFVLLWAYLAFMQYLVIWSEDLPGEIAWYLPRLAGSWRGVGISVIVLHFALPFVLLLSPRIKRRLPLLAAVAGTLLFAHLADVFWQVMPAFRPHGLSLQWSDCSALAGVGGLWLAAFLWRYAALRRPAASIGPANALGHA
jgi:hypothetical protein